MIVWSAFVAGELADRGIGFPVGPAGRVEVRACREAAMAGARAVVFEIASRQPAAELLKRPREIGAAAAAQTPRESSPKGNQRTDSSFGSFSLPPTDEADRKRMRNWIATAIADVASLPDLGGELHVNLLHLM